jgi:hypothetical protein
VDQEAWDAMKTASRMVREWFTSLPVSFPTSKRYDWAAGEWRARQGLPKSPEVCKCLHDSVLSALQVHWTGAAAGTEGIDFRYGGAMRVGVRWCASGRRWMRMGGSAGAVAASTLRETLSNDGGCETRGCLGTRAFSFRRSYNHLLDNANSEVTTKYASMPRHEDNVVPLPLSLMNRVNRPPFRNILLSAEIYGLGLVCTLGSISTEGLSRSRKGPSTKPDVGGRLHRTPMLTAVSKTMSRTVLGWGDYLLVPIRVVTVYSKHREDASGFIRALMLTDYLRQSCYEG